MSACMDKFLAGAISDRNCTELDDQSQIVYPEIVDIFVNNFNSSMEYNPWICAALGSTLIGLSGVLPLFIISVEDGINVKNGGKCLQKHSFILSLKLHILDQ